MRFLPLIAIVPALALCIYVYFMDRVEKEPFWLLAVMFALGAAVCIPMYYLRDLLGSLLDKAYAGQFVTSAVNGARTYVSDAARISHDAIYAFLIVAAIEETVKWFLILFVTNKCKDFDCLFDGIVYHVFYAFGFAVVETIRYTAADGMNMLLMRALTLIPSYLLFGIVSGFIYTLWHVYHTAAQREKQLIADGVYSSRKIHSHPILFALGLVIPVFVHGLCELTNLSPSRDLRFVYFCIVVLLYAICFIIVNVVSERDTENLKLADKIVRRAHKKDGAAEPAESLD